MDDHLPPEPDSTRATHARLLTAARLWRIAWIGGALVALLIALLGIYIAVAIPATPDVSHLQQARDDRPSVLLSADGKTLSSFREVQRQWVDLDHVSPYVVAGLIATEDQRFYEHHGVDWHRLIGAAFHTATGEMQGASTITQQLARNIFPERIGHSRTITRKIKEMLTALKIERHYTKRQILETYLNTVPFLYNVTGIEMAARTYFGKPAAQLNVTQSAMLVGMLKGTYYYNPVVNPQRALARRNVVLAQMMKAGQLPEHDFRRLEATPLALDFHRQVDNTDNSAPHFTAFVRRWLADWAQQNDVDLSADGLTIETTIDLTLQQAATQAVEREAATLQQIADVEWAQKSDRVQSTSPASYARLHKRIEPFSYFWDNNRELVDSFIRETPDFKKLAASGKSAAAAVAQLRDDAGFMQRLKTAKTQLQAGFVAMDPTSGEIKAWVGSRDFDEDQFDHVAQAARQPGSTFKPVVYGAALEQGFSPMRSYIDQQVTIRAPDGSLWRPTDMEAATLQPMTLRDALIYSKNTITAQVMQDVGLPNVIELAQAMGINRSKLQPVPSLALGTSPVTLLEMVSAYSTIAASGEYHKPVFIRRIIDRNGRVLAQFGHEERRAMTEETALDLIDMMRGVVNIGTGQMVKTRFGITADIAGKTGTTQNNTDGWFILMHPHLVAGAWVGFNDQRVTMRSTYWGQGGHNAALLVGDFFHDAFKAKLIDRRAQFARPKNPELLMADAVPSADAQLATIPGLAPGTGVITRADGTQVVIERPAQPVSTGGAAANPGRSATSPPPGIAPGTTIYTRADGTQVVIERPAAAMPAH